MPHSFIGTERMAKLGSTTTTATSSSQMSMRNDIDPTLFCTSYQRDRFYLFTNREPEEEGFALFVLK